MTAAAVRAKRSDMSWKFFILAGLLLACICLGCVWGIVASWKASAPAQPEPADGLASLAHRFFTGSPQGKSESFVRSCQGSGQSFLVLSKLRLVASITHAHPNKFMWLDAGPTRVEVQTLAFAHYGVNTSGLKSRTRFLPDADAPDTLLAIFPRLELHAVEVLTQETITVAKEHPQVWLWPEFERDADKIERRLEKNAYQYIRETARNPEQMAQARDPARFGLARFARDWLVGEKYWGERGFRRVKAIFEDEPPQKWKELPLYDEKAFSPR